jgi:hypothetical protein
VRWVWVGIPQETGRVDNRIILKRILKLGVDWIYVAHDKRQVACCCGYDNEPSVSI